MFNFFDTSKIQKVLVTLYLHIIIAEWCCKVLTNNIKDIKVNKMSWRNE